jgi:integrase
VTVDRDDFERLLNALPPHAKLWLLLCSDLALRSGTAANVGPGQYQPQNRTLEITTKYKARLTLPVTEEIRALIEQCDMDNPQPFIRQLWQAAPRSKAGRRPYKASLTNPTKNTAIARTVRDKMRELGITKWWTPHDLRRTTACAMYDQTHDLRDVQALLGHRNLASTIWYLDHRLRQVKRSNLELIKRPAWRKENIA